MTANLDHDLEKIGRILATARGERPADLLLINGRLVNYFTNEIEQTNVAITDGSIAAIGSDYDSGDEIVDLEGRYLAPGLIDAHLHIESTLLMPPELARVVVPRGTTCIINDPHEIANVLGIDGVMLMLAASEGLPCDFFATAPSCVPATDMETAGAELTTAQVSKLLGHPRIIGLGEMMNYPGLISGEKEVLAKIAAAARAGKVIDGHAPSVSGSALQAYLSSGISTDHECVTAAEALEKLRNGMRIIIRHGSASSSLAEMLPLVNDITVDAFMFGSDDREAGELVTKGHLDELLREAVSLGADPILVLKIATINAAKHYRLFDRGVVAPGYRADLVAFDDLRDFRVNLVVKDGCIAASKGVLFAALDSFKPPRKAMQSINIARPVNEDDFNFSAAARTIPLIGVIPGQIVTEKLQMEVNQDQSENLKANPAAGINKIAVVERHKASGRVAVGMVSGIGLKSGAIASSVAHDSHNIIVAGVEEKAMAAAVNELARIAGGFTVVDKMGRVKASLPLPVAGLMSTCSARTVAGNMEQLLKAAQELGTSLPQPFLTLAFLALPVIPSLKITDRGLFDVDNFKFL